jgi:hypothetical protein
MRDLEAIRPKPGHRNVVAFIWSLKHQTARLLRRIYMAHMNLHRWRLASKMGAVDMLLH